jgi:hypothetical protein
MPDGTAHERDPARRTPEKWRQDFPYTAGG